MNGSLNLAIDIPDALDGVPVCRADVADLINPFPASSPQLAYVLG